MNWRLETLDRFWIVGFSKRISLQFEGENHQLDELVGKMTPAVATHLKSINDRSPEGILNVSADFEDRTREGSMLDQYLGIASSRPQEGFACLEVPSLVAGGMRLQPHGRARDPAQPEHRLQRGRLPQRDLDSCACQVDLPFPIGKRLHRIGLL